MSFHLYLLAILMGAVTSIYIPMVSQSARIMGASVMGNVPFFFVAFVSSVAIALASGHREAFGKITQVPHWLFLSGVMSAAIVLGASFLVPRIGTGPLFVLLVTGQIVAGVAINQFGLLGVPARPMSLGVGVGAAMVIAGSVLVTFSAR